MPVIASSTRSNSSPAFINPPCTRTDQQRAQLSRRLRKLESLFPVAEIVAGDLNAPAVAAYYRDCHAAYTKHHSREGATHMALNADGRYSEAGFLEQPRRIAARWQSGLTKDVLEIGFGQGFNLAWLAPQHPGVRFQGIDLTPEHLAIARARMGALGLGNVNLVLGDMHALPQADASLDEVYAVEAFCYAQPASRVFAEVARVLRPGGRFSLFDGYQPRPPQPLQGDERLAVQLVARGMAVDRWQVPEELVAQACAHGLVLESMQVLDQQIMPNLLRLERLVGRVIAWPWLARRLLARRAPARGRNIISGWLMAPTVAMGLLGYREIVWRKAVV